MIMRTVVLHRTLNVDGDTLLSQIGVAAFKLELGNPSRGLDGLAAAESDLPLATTDVRADDSTGEGGTSGADSSGGLRSSRDEKRDGDRRTLSLLEGEVGGDSSADGLDAE